MAGIAGVLGQAARQGHVAAMLEILRHRGPDGHWLHREEGMAFGVRTADLGEEKGAGHAQESETIIFDGEIYNERPRGVSDAAVALDLYQRHGRLFASRLRGAFACAVWDGKQLVLARDPVGIRPLYWGRDPEGSLYFASECKALSGRVRDIHEVSPCTVFSTDAGVQTYLPVHPQPAVPDAVEEAKAALRQLLFQATERRLADGAVGGLLLSGGLDSSIIAAIACELKPGLTAFTVGVEGAPDLENAACVAAHVGMRHRTRILGADEINALIPRAVFALESFDEDCVSGAVANLAASAWAARETRCILSGEGGDELNGGYHLLKDLPGDEARRRCMEHLIDIAYNTALQRLDRAMMAHSIHYRTPFLDTDVMAFCLQMPVRWKIRAEAGGRFVEKWLLREAFKDMLPARIYRREKLRFSGGTGTDGVLDAFDPDPALSATDAVTPGGYRLASPKELKYYRLFAQQFPDPCFEALVGRWDPNKRGTA